MLRLLFLSFFIFGCGIKGKPLPPMVTTVQEVQKTPQTEKKK